MRYLSVVLTLGFLAAGLPAPSHAAIGLSPGWHIFASVHAAPLFYRASGVAVMPGSGIAVADSGDHRVSLFSQDGHAAGSLGVDSSGPLRFSVPRSVAVAPNGTIYVADRGIAVFTAAGKYRGRWTGGSLSSASQLATDRAGYLYALSLHPVPHANVNDRMTIDKVAPTGKIVAAWNYSYSTPADDSVIAASITTAPNGNLLLSFHGQHHCHACDGDYFQLWTLSPAGKRLSTWNVPFAGGSVAATATRTYLAAPNGIDMFDTNGNPAGTLGTAGCGPLAFGQDLRLAALPDGSLVVADSQVVAIGLASIPASLRAGVLHVLSAAGGSKGFFGQCPQVRPKVFGQISSLAPLNSGGMWVSDEGNGLVDRLGSNGALQTSMPAEHPVFVAVDPRGNLYIPDIMRQVLEKRSPAGTLLATFPSMVFEDAVIAGSGTMYAIAYDGTVHVLKTSPSSGAAGKPATLPVIRSWRLKGYQPDNGGLDPMGIAVDRQGNVYVADTRFSAIQKFSSSGKLLGYWGGRQSFSPGKFHNPTGVAIDSKGHVFVLDAGNNRVQELDGSGRLLAVLGRYGMGSGQMISPVGIAVDAQDHVYVGDNGNDRILEWVQR